MSEIKNIRVGVSVAIVNDEGDVLIMMNRKTKRWTLPGGKVEDGETPEEAIIRETKEEVGIDLISIREISMRRDIYPALEDEGYPEVKVETILFLADEYRGNVINMEPKKHSMLDFQSDDQVSDCVESPGDAYRSLWMYMKWMMGMILISEIP